MGERFQINNKPGIFALAIFLFLGVFAFRWLNEISSQIPYSLVHVRNSKVAKITQKSNRKPASLAGVELSQEQLAELHVKELLKVSFDKSSKEIYRQLERIRKLHDSARTE